MNSQDRAPPPAKNWSSRLGQQAEADTVRPRTRIQKVKREAIIEAALGVFSARGFRGATIDEIATAAGMSKPNLLYYYAGKEAIYEVLLDQLLDRWLAPLSELDPDGDPFEELASYIRRKIGMSRDFPRESRLFANEILQGAPRIRARLAGAMKALVYDKAAVLSRWMDEGRLARTDPHHLIFAIWATTQHYADFDAQVQAVLGERAGAQRFDDAARVLERLFLNGLQPR